MMVNCNRHFNEVSPSPCKPRQVIGQNSKLNDLFDMIHSYLFIYTHQSAPLEFRCIQKKIWGGGGWVMQCMMNGSIDLGDQGGSNYQHKRKLSSIISSIAKFCILLSSEIFGLLTWLVAWTKPQQWADDQISVNSWGLDSLLMN